MLPSSYLIFLLRKLADFPWAILLQSLSITNKQQAQAVLKTENWQLKTMWLAILATFNCQMFGLAKTNTSN